LLGKLCLGIKIALNPDILRNGEKNAQKGLSISISKVKKTSRPIKVMIQTMGRKSFI
jgi:hypothetical protein